MVVRRDNGRWSKGSEASAPWPRNAERLHPEIKALVEITKPPLFNLKAYWMNAAPKATVNADSVSRLRPVEPDMRIDQ